MPFRLDPHCLFYFAGLLSGGGEMSRLACGNLTLAYSLSKTRTAGRVSYRPAVGSALGLLGSMNRLAFVKLILRCSASLHELMRASYVCGLGDVSSSRLKWAGDFWSGLVTSVRMNWFGLVTVLGDVSVFMN